MAIMYRPSLTARPKTSQFYRMCLLIIMQTVVLCRSHISTKTSIHEKSKEFDLPTGHNSVQYKKLSSHGFSQKRNDEFMQNSMTTEKTIPSFENHFFFTHSHRGRREKLALADERRFLSKDKVKYHSSGRTGKENTEPEQNVEELKRNKERLISFKSHQKLDLPRVKHGHGVPGFQKRIRFIPSNRETNEVPTLILYYLKKLYSNRVGPLKRMKRFSSHQDLQRAKEQPKGIATGFNVNQSVTPPHGLDQRVTPSHDVDQKSVTPPHDVDQKSVTPPHEVDKNSDTPPTGVDQKGVRPPPGVDQNSDTPPHHVDQRDLDITRHSLSDDQIEDESNFFMKPIMMPDQQLLRQTPLTISVDRVTSTFGQPDGHTTVTSSSASSEHQMSTTSGPLGQGEEQAAVMSTAADQLENNSTLKLSEGFWGPKETTRPDSHSLDKRLSCDGICHKFTYTHICSCDRLCFFMKTCCEDIDEKCPGLREQSVKEVGLSLLNASVQCEYSAHTFHVTSCPNDADENHDDHEENPLGIDILVSDSSTGIVYQNMERFRCNTRGSTSANPVSWDIVVEIRPEMEWKGMESVNDAAHLLANSKYSFIPPANTFGVNAYPCAKNSYVKPSYRLSVLFNLSPDYKDVHVVSTKLKDTWEDVDCDERKGSSNPLVHEVCSPKKEDIPVQEYFEIFINVFISHPNGLLGRDDIDVVIDDVLCVFNQQDTTVDASVVEIEEDTEHRPTFQNPGDTKLTVHDIFRMRYFRVLFAARVVTLNSTYTELFFKEAITYRLYEKGIVSDDGYLRYGILLAADDIQMTENVTESNPAGNGADTDEGQAWNPPLLGLNNNIVREPVKKTNIKTMLKPIRPTANGGIIRPMLMQGSGKDEGENVQIGCASCGMLSDSDSETSNATEIHNGSVVGPTLREGSRWASSMDIQSKGDTKSLTNIKIGSSFLGPSFDKIHNNFAPKNISTTTDNMETTVTGSPVTENPVNCKPGKYLMICVGIYLDRKPAEKDCSSNLQSRQMEIMKATVMRSHQTEMTHYDFAQCPEGRKQARRGMKPLCYRVLKSASVRRMDSGTEEPVTTNPIGFIANLVPPNNSSRTAMNKKHPQKTYLPGRAVRLGFDDIGISVSVTMALALHISALNCNL